MLIYKISPGFLRDLAVQNCTGQLSSRTTFKANRPIQQQQLATFYLEHTQPDLEHELAKHSCLYFVHWKHTKSRATRVNLFM